MSARITKAAPNHAPLDRGPGVRPSRRDLLRDENISLVNRLMVLRCALEGLAVDNAAARRQLAQLRAENRALRAALAERTHE